MNINLMHPAEQIVTIIDRIYKYGMTTTSGGNLSIIDDNGDIWITPGGIDKGTLTTKDIMRIKPDGTIIGIHKPSSELPFHQNIYKTQLGVKAILHAHPPALVSFSIVRKNPEIRLLSSAYSICGNIEMAVYGVPGSKDLGEKIAKVFKKGINTVMLENHGVVIGETDIFKAFQIFETLDFAARTEINALCIGKSSPLTESQLKENKQLKNVEEIEIKNITSEEKSFRKGLCLLTKRSYDQKLFTGSQGTFSRRINNNSFIIPCEKYDRKYICENDVVHIENGKTEKGKIPDKYFELHKAIFDNKPFVNSIVIASPPAIMAFAVTKELFISRTIPESYILLRDIPRFSYNDLKNSPEKIVDAISKKVPVIMVENDSVIVTGDTLLSVFDRLEVLEYSAKAIIDSRRIGNIVVIDDKQTKDLEIAFNLD
jgi:L-fuculose-phosphate aldolase